MGMHNSGVYFERGRVLRYPYGLMLLFLFCVGKCVVCITRKAKHHTITLR